MLVCRSWHANFSPYLWQTITVRRRRTFNKIKSTSVQTKLAQNICSVLSIDSTFADIWPLFSNIPINCLTVLWSPSLVTKASNRINNQKYFSNIIDLVIACMSLRILETSFLSNIVQGSERFILAIQNHGHLRELRIESAVSVHSTIVRHLLLSCGNLEQLHLQFYIHGYHLAATLEQDMQELLEITGSKTPSLKLKELSSSCRQVIAGYILLPILRLCPRLEQFTVPRLFIQSGYPAIAGVISKTITQLQHLDMCER
ncbi:MAG: hypothetical protein BYD32DRAFT_418930 [Podila humilis]|nr:MAG: hypothetical protein BYD32DRAFT_418930 [Podila humilis]